MPERFICSGIGALFYVGGKPKPGLARNPGGRLQSSCHKSPLITVSHGKGLFPIEKSCYNRTGITKNRKYDEHGYDR